MAGWRIVHVDYQSSPREKDAVSRFWEGTYLEMTRSRLDGPWGGERYGIAGAFVGERCVGTTSYTISRRGQGILSQVHTDPDFRKQGICRATVDAALDAFRSLGARAVYLAAWSDWIRNIYRKRGFELIGTMGERHAFKLTLAESGRDENLFRPGQAAVFRRMENEDQGDISALFNARHPVVVKHYDLGCFEGSHFEGEFYVLQNQTVAGIVAEERKPKAGFRAMVLDGEETILGFGTIIPSSRRHEGHGGILDFLIHPNYTDMSEEFLACLEEETELDHLDVYAGQGEYGKRELLEAAGFRALAPLDRQLNIAGVFRDLILFRKTYR